MGYTAVRGRGEQDFLSSAGSAPQLGGCLSSAAPGSIPRCGGPGVGLLVPWVLLPVPGTLLSLPSCGCAEGRGPQERRGSTRGTPVLLCPQRAGDTTQVEGQGWPGARTAPLPALGELGPPSARQPLAVPEPCLGRFAPLASVRARTLPTVAVRRKSLRMLPQPGQWGPAYVPMGTQSSPRETWGTRVPIGMLVISWCWLLGSDP